MSVQLKISFETNFLFCVKLHLAALKVKSVDKAKGRMSKQLFQEKQSTPNLPKNKHLLPPNMHTYATVKASMK